MDLLALLNWKAHPDRVLDILGRLRQISGEEIVKVALITLFIRRCVFTFRVCVFKCDFMDNR